MTSISIPDSILDQIRQHAEAAYPHECCGILLGTGTTVTEARPAKNVAPPSRHHDRYEIDPALLLQLQKESRITGTDMIACYHSHPNHPALPSQTDIDRAWHPLIYLIIEVRNGKSLPPRAYTFPNQHPQEIPILPLTPRTDGHAQPANS